MSINKSPKYSQEYKKKKKTLFLISVSLYLLPVPLTTSGTNTLGVKLHLIYCLHHGNPFQAYFRLISGLFPIGWSQAEPLVSTNSNF